MVPAPGSTAGTAIRRNIGNLGSIYDLAGSYDAFQTAQAAQQFSSNLPLYDVTNQQQMQNIYDWSQGKLGEDVIGALWQAGAERGLGRGAAEIDPNANAAYLRALGLTSYDVQQRAVPMFTEAMARTPRAELFKPESMMISPQMEQEAEYWADLYASMPDPRAAALEEEARLRRGINLGQGRTGGTQGSTWTSGVTTRHIPGAPGGGSGVGTLADWWS